MKLGMFYNKPQSEYHKWDGFMSSSPLKILLNDPILFHKKYILKTVPQEQKDCFDVGNAFHGRLLEPKIFEKEFIKFTGKIRRGKDWEEFKQKNSDKTILGNKSWLEYQILIKSILSNKYALQTLKGGKNEVSIYIKINDFPVKVRFDTINGSGAGVDLKSTTGDLIGLKGKTACMVKIAELDYDLSAALYVDAYNTFEMILAKKQNREAKLMTDWYWIFASKDHENARVFRATPAMLMNGRKKYMLAITAYQQHEKTGWKSDALIEKIEDIDPLPSDVIHDGTVLTKGVSGW